MTTVMNTEMKYKAQYEKMYELYKKTDEWKIQAKSDSKQIVASSISVEVDQFTIIIILIVSNISSTSLPHSYFFSQYIP